MAIRKQPTGAPVKLGPIYMANYRRRRPAGQGRLWLLGLGAFAGVFTGGMAITNWSAISALVSGSQSDTISFSSCGLIRRNCVVDGDTFWLHGEKVRIANIDTPETPGSARCKNLRIGKNPSWCDFELGSKARVALATTLSGGPVVLSPQGKDKYGRTLATVSVGGRDVGDALIEQGVARRWED